MGERLGGLRRLPRGERGRRPSRRLALDIRKLRRRKLRMWIIASLVLATVLFVVGFVIWWSNQNPPFRKL